MPTDLNQEWDGPIEIPDVVITQPQRDSPNADIIYTVCTGVTHNSKPTHSGSEFNVSGMGPITRRRSTIDSLPQENTCLCGDCLCCCVRLCPWCF